MYRSQRENKLQWRQILPNLKIQNNDNHQYSQTGNVEVLLKAIVASFNNAKSAIGQRHSGQPGRKNNGHGNENLWECTPVGR